MRASGKFTVDQMRTINETRMHAVWKLGQLLAKMERATGPGRGSRPGKSFCRQEARAGPPDRARPGARRKPRAPPASSRSIRCAPSTKPDARGPAAVLASVKDKPSAALKKRRP